MGITAKELAKKLNLSAAAVSMALNGKPGVSTKTRAMVMEAAEKYGYDFTRIKPVEKPSGSIYFVVYKKNGAIVSDTQFFSELTEGVSLGCQKHGYPFKITYLYEDEDTLEKHIEDIQYSDCIGVILLGTEMNEDSVKKFTSLPIPVLVLDTYFENLDLDFVLINNQRGAYQAVNYLLRKCKCQPGYLRSSYPIHNFDDRANGFYKAVRESGMSPSKSIVHRLTPSIDGAYTDMMEILESGEELAGCYFADNDLIALGAMKALRQKGISMPDQVSVIGFDNLTLGTFMEPTLTTVHVPKKDLGAMAAERIIDRIEHPGLATIKLEMATTLVKRRSVRVSQDNR